MCVQGTVLSGQEHTKGGRLCQELRGKTLTPNTGHLRVESLLTGSESQGLGGLGLGWGAAKASVDYPKEGGN